MTSLNKEGRKTRDLLKIKEPWPKPKRSFNAQLIPKKLQELALAGKYFDSRVLN